MNSPAQQPQFRLRLRLRRRGAALVAVGGTAAVAGEVDAIAALVAVGVATLVLVGLAALAALPAGRRAAGRVVPWLTGVGPQVRPGQVVEVVVGVAGGAAGAGDGGTAAARAGDGSPGIASGRFEVDDPAGRWCLYRRHGVVASATGRLGRLAVTANDPAGHRRRLVAPGRGVLEIGPLELWLADMFGIAEIAVGRAGPWRALAVDPPVASSDPGRRTGRTGGAAAGQRAAPGPGTADGDLLELQPLRGPAVAGPVHWPTTLRTGTPVVRRFAAPALRGTIIHLDLRPACHSAATVEVAVTAAGGLAAAELARGRPVQLTGTGQPPARIEPGPGSLPSLSAWLALADLDRAGAVGPPPPAGPQPTVVVTTGSGRSRWADAGTEVLVVDARTGTGS